MGEALALMPDRTGALFVGGALCLLVGLFLGAKLAGLWSAWRERARGHAQRAQGLRGEREAERLLRAHGYAIRERNAQHAYAIRVDGARERVALALDFLVERDGELLVAEVKTGQHGPRVQRAETRRQLLEYQLATGARCVLLVDPDQGRITEVAFPLGVGEPLPVQGPVLWRASVIALALVLGIVWWVNGQP
jgi:hypothetical protein